MRRVYIDRLDVNRSSPISCFICGIRTVEESLVASQGGAKNNIRGDDFKHYSVAGASYECMQQIAHPMNV
jgi:hypothetical protein